MVIPASSTEYLHVPASAPGIDLTNSPVKIAVVEHRSNPADDDWHDAEWVDGQARILIGPDSGALALTEDTYRVWITIDPPGAENIVRLAGTLIIT